MGHAKLTVIKTVLVTIEVKNLQIIQQTRPSGRLDLSTEQYSRYVPAAVADDAPLYSFVAAPQYKLRTKRNDIIVLLGVPLNKFLFRDAR